MVQERSTEGVPARRRRVAAWLAVTMVALLIAAACGGDDDDATATTTTAAASGASTTAGGETTTTALEPVDPLKVTIGSRSEVYGATWIALGENLFEKHGVPVEVTSYDGIATGLAQLSADQIDLFFFTPLLGLNLANQGIPMSFIYRFSDLDYRTAAFATAKDVATIDDLRAMGSDCRVASTSVGTSFYRMALAFSEAYGLQCELVPQASGNLQVPALASGEVQGAVVVPTMAYQASKDGIINLQYDPRSVTEEEGAKVFAESYPHIVVFGKKAVLEEKHEAVVRFVSALQEASQIIETSTPLDLANITVKVEPWATTDPAASAESWAVIQKQVPLGDQAGHIAEDEWNNVLNGLVEWGVEGVDPADPDIAYDAVIDMSYFDEALARQ